jgi:hypothetical protein
MTLTVDQRVLYDMITYMVKDYSKDYYHENWSTCKTAVKDFVLGTITSEQCINVISIFDLLSEHKSRKLTALLNNHEFLESTYNKKIKKLVAE